MGQSGLAGSLSVPQGWTAAVPARAAAALVGTNFGTVAAVDTDGPGSMLGGFPLSGSAGRGVAGLVPDSRFLERPPMVPHWSPLG
ncbi:PPE family protein, SVP subgroup [Mycobacterium gordonae]|uniref:PPE family protein, SVP subgroup n=1 Tax=Mycobacterium gordonae TaxID=1778 RepID=UPI003AFFB284